MTKPKILIAEDEMNLREVLRFQLTTAGYEVVEAEDGLAALDWLESNEFEGYPV